MKTSGFPKSSRLLTPRDYSGVFDDVRIRVPHRHFLILATPNDLGHPRVGLVFSKKNLKLAVQRNRIKRQVRETFRHQPGLPAVDIVVLSRQGLVDIANTDVSRMLEDIWQRLIRKSAQSQQTDQSSVAANKGNG
ncbi:ribonuclease P protein component [Marinobacter salicampi]|uniref:ribonuclease P protein component n=1 Tax=Marinobacter salicampi TaxID=435907 RepID=UPI00140CA96A|nr:ribonuclease P protein component [Marinobacter salicampi]